MIAQPQPVKYYDLAARLPADANLVLHGVSWQEYEALLDAVGEAKRWRISYHRGTLQIMTISIAHEHYSKVIERLIDRLSMLWRIKVLCFGSATLKKQRELAGVEPDACFYVQNADVIGSRLDLDFSVDPPPDIVVEVDIHHESISRFPIYAALGVPEIWHYDTQVLQIHQLQQGQYVESPVSPAFPQLTADLLTEFLDRSKVEDQYEVLLAFEDWLKTQSK